MNLSPSAMQVWLVHGLSAHVIAGRAESPDIYCMSHNPHSGLTQTTLRKLLSLLHSPNFDKYVRRWPGLHRQDTVTRSEGVRYSGTALSNTFEA